MPADLPFKIGRNILGYPRQLSWTWASSVEVEFKVEGSRAEWIETLEAVEASVEVLMMLALWIHGILSVVKLGSHF